MGFPGRFVSFALDLLPEGNQNVLGSLKAMSAVNLAS